MKVQKLVFSFALFCGRTLSDGADSEQQKDPWDLSYLTVGAAIGDSYTAGIGAGNRIDWGCSRYDGSYPNLVMQQLGSDPKGIHFGFTACSGAKIPEIKEQAVKLSRKDYQFIIISAGGNDADLSGILNSCVFNFLTGAKHPKCEPKLDESEATIKSKGFADSVDDLISTSKKKLADGGNIYYVGYAKFFDTTDKGCDQVAWRFWGWPSAAEYRTQKRRQRMNDLVDMMNDALRAAVGRAGPQVHFIDYDHYIDITHGRYCQPGDDESDGRSANREDLFFYEMKTTDTPWQVPDPEIHSELRRRNNSMNDDGDIEPKNGTLNAVIGALIQQTIVETPFAVTDDDTVDPSVDRTFGGGGLPGLPGFLQGLNPQSPDVVKAAVATNNNQKYRPQIKSQTGPPNAALGSKVVISNGQISKVSNEAHVKNARSTDQNRTLAGHAPTNQTVLNQNQNPSNNTTTQRTGTVIANETHILFSHGPVSRDFASNLRYLIPDTWARVFHPTQGGHTVIANLILYQMATDNARRLGLKDFVPFEVESLGGHVPVIGGAACKTDSSNTWTDRDAMNTAAKAFCADPKNLKGIKGASTSSTFDENTLNYMNISIAWQQDANIGQHSCEAWLGVVTDGCDVPHDGQNAANLKHGGTIGYESGIVNATLTVEPLIVRRMFDKGKADKHQCNNVGSRRYLSQATLDDNINKYCSDSASKGIGNRSTTFVRDYNEDTPSRVQLRTEWPPGWREYQIFEEECKYYMGVLNNGCSLPVGDNVMNWKHGGSMNDNNGVSYKIVPAEDRLPAPKAIQGTCTAASVFAQGYIVDINGTGWSDADSGDRLRNELSGCPYWGSLSDWSFRYTPLDSQWEWRAHAWLPWTIGDSCVGKAVERAGGPSAHC